MIAILRTFKRHYGVQTATAYAVVSLFMFGNAEAQDLDPRRYINVPVDQNFLRIGYVHSEGDVNVDSSVPLENAYLIMDGGSAAYLRTMDVGGKAATVDMYMLHMCASGHADLDGEQIDRSVCGQGDAAFRFTYNFIGAPALELTEFVKREKEIVVGASLQVSAPTGQYDDDYLVNIGANRWVIRPEIGISVPWRKWSFEFAAGVRFFTNNDDYIGDVTLKQDPLYNLQTHLIYDLTPRQWLSLDANYFFGGATYIDSVPQPTRQENSRLGLTWYVVLNFKHVLKFAAHRGVVTRIGNDSDTVSAAWVYRWD